MYWKYYKFLGRRLKIILSKFFSSQNSVHNFGSPLRHPTDYFLKMEFETVGYQAESEEEFTVDAAGTKEMDTLISSIYVYLWLAAFPWKDAVQLTETELLSVLFSYVRFFYFILQHVAEFARRNHSTTFQGSISWSCEACVQGSQACSQWSEGRRSPTHSEQRLGTARLCNLFSRYYLLE